MDMACFSLFFSAKLLGASIHAEFLLLKLAGARPAGAK
jgi:hypothetical protein